MVELTPAVCPKCGAQLEIPKDMERAHCMYCGTEIIIEKSTRSDSHSHVHYHFEGDTPTALPEVVKAEVKPSKLPSVIRQDKEKRLKQLYQRRPFIINRKAYWSQRTVKGTRKGCMVGIIILLFLLLPLGYFIYDYADHLYFKDTELYLDDSGEWVEIGTYPTTSWYDLVPEDEWWRETNEAHFRLMCFFAIIPLIPLIIVIYVFVTANQEKIERNVKAQVEALKIVNNEIEKLEKELSE